MSKIKLSDGRWFDPADLRMFDQFIKAQLARREEISDDEDRPIVHADCGFGDSTP